MAVKKVGQGKPKRVNCKNCGAKLEYYPKDVKHKSYTVMCEAEVVSWIVCPACKAQTTLTK